MSGARRSRGDGGDAGVTAALAGFAAGVAVEELDAAVVEVARQCILDWIGVTIAAVDEPLVAALRAQAVDEGGAAQARLIPTGQAVPARQAALVNGVAGHALDFDDSLPALRGHPTATVLPAALAAAEQTGAGGAELLAAFAAGVEVAARVGVLLGEDHYARGWHATATVGCIGAAAAAARLLGLDADATARAMGLAGVQAAGLKSAFGTMAKPFQVGKAAANGLGAALLAGRGVTAPTDVLDCDQGMAATLSRKADPGAALAGLGGRWHVPDILFKYHAACFGTHAPIEAAAQVRADPAFDAGSVEAVEVRVAPRWLSVCNISAPETGLQAKFSLVFTTAVALSGGDTGALETYADATLGRPEVARLMGLVEVVTDEDMGRNQARVGVRLTGGRRLERNHDSGIPERHLGRQGEALAAKFRSLVEPVLGAPGCASVLSLVDSLEQLERVSDLTAATTGSLA